MVSTQFPSIGQAQVLQIALEMLEEFCIDPVTLWENTDSRAYNTLLVRLANDSTVCNDPYTGGRIVEAGVANSYINWLTNRAQSSSERVSKQRFLSLDFNRMAFMGSVAGSWNIDPERKVYQGGARASVTARAVLTLAKGGKLDTNDFSLSYLANSRIMRITGGNHRLLAYKLLGIADFPTEHLLDHQLTMYEDLPNERLNQALLRLESLCAAYDPRNNQVPGLLGNEELVMQLGAAYGAYSDDAGYNGLYDFVKKDLAQLRARSLNRPEQSNFYNPSLLLFSDYAQAYQYFMGFTSQSWLTRLMKEKRLGETLSASQKEIHERLVAASMNKD